MNWKLKLQCEGDEK